MVLRVTEDFDFVVLGVSVGAIPFVAREILARDARWRAMVDNVKTVATQALMLLNSRFIAVACHAPSKQDPLRPHEQVRPPEPSIG